MNSIFLNVYISFYVSPKPAILQCIENFALEGTVSYFFHIGHRFLQNEKDLVYYMSPGWENNWKIQENSLKIV